MIPLSDERLNNERKSCCKCFLTLLFLFILLLIIRKQKEEEEEETKNKNKLNLRRNENYNRSFAFGYMREISVLKYESIVYISANRKVLPSIRYINDYTVHVDGYDNILHNFVNLSIRINKDNNNNFYINILPDHKYDNHICLDNNHSDDNCAKINTVLVDDSIFKKLEIQSCLNGYNKFCFFIFVQLKKDKCYNFRNLSYSCHVNTMKNPNLFLIDDYCYVVIASNNISSVYEFIKLNLLDNNNFNKNAKNDYVEIITHFCGNLLNQIATIDAVNFRLLFIQQYIQANDKGINNEVKQDNIELNMNDQKNSIYRKYIKKEYDNSLRFKINYYLTVIDLSSEYKDIITYIEYMKNKPEFTYFSPIHIAYDEQLNVYYIVQYETNGLLNFIYISPSKLSIYYSLKISDFYSGWLLNPSYEYDRKGLMLMGNSTPYEDELQVWDVKNFQHNRYFINVIKAY